MAGLGINAMLGLGKLGLKTMANPIGRVAVGGLVGAGYGAIQGGGTVENRVANAALYGMAGAGIGIGTTGFGISRLLGAAETLGIAGGRIGLGIGKAALPGVKTATYERALKPLGPMPTKPKCGLDKLGPEMEGYKAVADPIKSKMLEARKKLFAMKKADKLAPWKRLSDPFTMDEARYEYEYFRKHHVGLRSQQLAERRPTLQYGWDTSNRAIAANARPETYTQKELTMPPLFRRSTLATGGVFAGGAYLATRGPKSGPGPGEGAIIGLPDSLQPMSPVTRNFRASTEGLTFGLHARRHR